MAILITGAAGQLGRLVVDSLLARGVEPSAVRAGARDVAKAADLADRGVQVVALDYDAPATVAAAVEGVDAMLLISGSEVGKRAAQHQVVIDAARVAGVAKLVYTSASKAATSKLVLAPEHKATEEAIAASGIPAVILRNNLYTENYVAVVARARETGVIAASVGEGRVASASRIDYAVAAAVALTEDRHIGQVYELGGDAAWSFDELAAVTSDLTGREVRYMPLTTAEHTAALETAGLDASTVGFVTALDANIRDGALAETDGTLSLLLGRPTTPLDEGLRAAL